MKTSDSTHNIKKENSILFLGDVVPYKPFKFKNTFKTVFNLECPITSVGNPIVNKINLRVNKNYLNDIFEERLLCLCISNNHILDYGKEGLDSTLTELAKIKTQQFGLNSDPEDKYTPLIYKFNTIKIAFFAVVCKSTTPVVELNNKTYLDLLNPDKLIEGILKVRNTVQKIIIYIHWGVEESSYPTAEDVLLARKFVDVGADIIIGCHAHAPQSIERYNHGIIAYNLGNFLMPKIKNMPSYFNERGAPLSSFSKSSMLWNRVSWGLIVNVESMEYQIKKYTFFFNRIIELPFTPLDKYIKLNQNVFSSSYEALLKGHLKRRAFYRKIIDFIHRPYIPQRIKKLI